MWWFFISWAVTAGHYILIVKTSGGPASFWNSELGIFAVATVVSMVFGGLCFRARRKRGKSHWYKAKKPAVVAACCHALLGALFLVQIFDPEFPVSAVVASLPLRLISWIQLDVFRQFPAWLGSVAVFFFPPIIHQIFVFWNTYFLFSSLSQLFAPQKTVSEAGIS